MIEVRASGFGQPAAEELRDILRAYKRNDPLEPCTVLVPTNYVGVSIRRRLASGQLGAITTAGSGIAGVDLLTTYRLAELLAAPELAAGGRRPVSTPVVAAAIRGVLTSAPGAFGGVADHPSTEKALVRAHRELRDLDETQLDVLAGASRRAADVVRVHRATEQALAADWFDEFDLLEAATGLIGKSPERVTAFGHLVLYLPQELSQSAARLLREIGIHQAVTAVLGVTGVERVDSAADEIARRLGGSIPSHDIAPANGDHIISVSDGDDEVRTVVRHVLRDLDLGVPLERIAVLYGSPEPYARLLDEQLNAAGIERNGDAVRRLDETLAGRTALALLALPDHGFRRSELFELLTTAPIRQRAGEPGLVPVAAWERVARAAGVIGGVTEWQQRLGQYSSELGQDLERFERTEPDHPAVAALRSERSLCADLEAFLRELWESLDAKTLPRSWPDLTTWLGQLLDRYLGPDEDSWPDAERLAFDQVARALRRLAGLEQIEPETTLTVFRRTLELELDAGLGRVGSVGEGAFVGRIAQALGMEFDRTYVLGLAEGIAPARRRDDSLLPDHERQLLGRALPFRAGDVDEQQRFLLAALASTSGPRTLLFPRGDLRRSAERVPSRWLLDTATALGGRRLDARSFAAAARDGEVPWLHESPSYLAGLRAATFPATEQEHALATLLTHLEHGGAVADHHLSRTSQAFAQGVELSSARGSRTFTRFDGNLAGIVSAEGVRADVLAPTRLEDWAACPRHYFMRSVLGVGEIDTPEALLRISALDKGNLMHEALEIYLDQRDPDSVYSQADHELLAEIGARLANRLEGRGLVGKQIFWQRDRREILGDLDEFLRQDQLRERRGSVVGSEVGFGVPGATMPAVTHVLPSGKSVRFRGSIDRLERTPGGGYIVIDYKTGSDRTYRLISQENPDLGGTRLQLPVYALAARAAGQNPDAAVHAAYWFITERRGQWRWRGLDIDEQVMQRFDEAVSVIVDGIEHGVFPAHPPERDNPAFVECVYCNPDGLGTSELRAQWVRKRHDPTLETYLALAEPEALLDV